MKIAVIGYSGAGKSTLAAALGARCGVPALHLDRVYWLPGWRERPPQEARALVGAFLDAHDGWVIDGNYRGLHYDRRMAEADRIVLLALNRWRCLGRVLKRYRRYRGRTRPDMGEGCPEKADREFLRWVLWDGRTKKRRAQYRAVAARFPEKTVILTSQKQIDRFEATLGVK